MQCLNRPSLRTCISHFHRFRGLLELSSQAELLDALRSNMDETAFDFASKVLTGYVGTCGGLSVASALRPVLSTTWQYPGMLCNHASSYISLHDYFIYSKTGC